MGSLLLPYATTGLSLIAGRCLIGATPRGQPWKPAVTLPHGRDGLSVLLQVFGTFRRLSICHPVPRQFMRNELLDLATIVPATAYHRRSDAERYSRSMGSCPYAHDIYRDGPRVSLGSGTVRG
jgi:hypothetical protein